MNCNKCGNQIWLDHVKDEDGKTVYFYACVNPQCSEYRKAFTPMGAKEEAQIKEG